MLKFKIKEIRKLKNLSQDELANRLGCSRSYVSKLERAGWASIKLSTVKKLIIALEIKPCELFYHCDTCEFKHKHNKPT